MNISIILVALHEKTPKQETNIVKYYTIDIKNEIPLKYKIFTLTILATGKQICRLYALFYSKPKRILKDRARDFMDFGTEQYSTDTCPIPLRHDLSHSCFSHTTHNSQVSNFELQSIYAYVNC